MMNLTILLALFACRPESDVVLLPRALHLAALEEPSAWAACEEVADAESRAMCLVEASRGQADRSSACASIPLVRWRQECWFAYAEDLTIDRQWAQAIEACRSSSDYARECGRHLWWALDAEIVVDPTGLHLLRDAFPDDATSEGRPSEAVLAARSGSTREDLQEFLSERSERRAASAADNQRLSASWLSQFNKMSTIDPSLCPPEEREACVAAASLAFEARWRRAAEAHPDALADLCAGAAPAIVRLRSGGDPDLERVLGRLRGELCP